MSVLAVFDVSDLFGRQVYKCPVCGEAIVCEKDISNRSLNVFFEKESCRKHALLTVDETDFVTVESLENP